MTLEDIIKENAARCRDVSVKIGRKLGTVEISDPHGQQGEILLQDDDAADFINRLDGLVFVGVDVLLEEVVKHLAVPYVDSFWPV